MASTSRSQTGKLYGRAPMFSTKRQDGVFDKTKFRSAVHLIGLGGMGSHMVAGLVRMGLGQEHSPLHLYDHDHFEEHNLSNQYTFRPLLGVSKAAAMSQVLKLIEPELCHKAYVSKVTRNTPLSGVVILCLDDNDERKPIIMENLRDNKNVSAVIETRMDAGVGMSFCFDPNCDAHIRCWNVHWHPQEEAENMLGCGGAQSIISAINGTVMLALKQFEVLARTGTTHGMNNRVYMDFDKLAVRGEIWPTELDQDGFAK